MRGLLVVVMVAGCTEEPDDVIPSDCGIRTARILEPAPDAVITPGPVGVRVRWHPYRGGERVTIDSASGETFDPSPIRPPFDGQDEATYQFVLPARSRLTVAVWGYCYASHHIDAVMVRPILENYATSQFSTGD
jgi:hypothetical protein